MWIGYYVVLGVGFLASFIVGQVLKSKFKKYSQVPMQAGLSGKEVAERMLRDYGITDVRVQSVQGQLTDHYNPANKTVNLSPEVYQGRSVAAAAVAAHECGHAVQHATAYSWLQMRSSMVPIQNVSGKILNIVLLVAFVGGSLIFQIIPFDIVLLIIIGTYGVLTAFSFVTLPVEFDASKRAMQWIDERGVVTSQQYDQAKDALNWAAMTYVVAALSSLAMLMYYVFLLLGSRR